MINTSQDTLKLTNFGHWDGLEGQGDIGLRGAHHKDERDSEGIEKLHAGVGCESESHHLCVHAQDEPTTCP